MRWALLVLLVGCAHREPTSPQLPPPSKETAEPARVAEKAAAVRSRLEALFACLGVTATFEVHERPVMTLSATVDVADDLVVERGFVCPGEDAPTSYLINPAALPRARGFVVHVFFAAKLTTYADARHWESPCGHDFGDSRGWMQGEQGVRIDLVRMLPRPHGQPPFPGVVLLTGPGVPARFVEDVRATVFGSDPVRCKAP